MLTLSEAIESGQLQEFIAQEEARGVGPSTEAEFDAATRSMVKTLQSVDQTSGSLRHDSSSEK